MKSNGLLKLITQQKKERKTNQKMEWKKFKNYFKSCVLCAPLLLNLLENEYHRLMNT